MFIFHIEFVYILKFYIKRIGTPRVMYPFKILLIVLLIKKLEPSPSLDYALTYPGSVLECEGLDCTFLMLN